MTRRVVTSRIRSIVLCGGIVALCLAAVGCSGELDPTDPGEAYLLFRKAMIEDDVDKMWKRSSQGTRDYFDQRHQQLVQMQQKIEKYLPQTDHKLARKQSGTELLDELEGGRELFERVVKPDRVAMNEARRIGSQVEEIRRSKDGDKAKVQTRSGRTYRLVREGEKGQWYVSLVDSVGSVDKSFAWLDGNMEALTKTVNDLIEEEKEKREEIIAELMDVE